MSTSPTKIWLPRVLIIAVCAIALYLMPRPSQLIAILLGVMFGMTVLTLLLTGLVIHLQLRDAQKPRKDLVLIRRGNVLMAIGSGLGGVGAIGMFLGPWGHQIMSLGLWIFSIGYFTRMWGDPDYVWRLPRSTTLIDASDEGKHDTAGRLLASRKPRRVSSPTRDDRVP